MSRIGLISVSLLAFGAMCLPASAQRDAYAPQSRVVGYGDLNLDSNAGADALIGRIENATDAVCGDRTGPRPLDESSTVHQCQGETAANAVRDVGHPNVVRRYFGYTPQVIIGDEDDYGYAEKGKAG